MELHDQKALNFIANTTGSIRSSLHELTTSLDRISDLVDLSDKDIARQTAIAMRSILRIQRIACYMDMYRTLTDGTYTGTRRPVCDLSFVGQILEEAKSMLESVGIRLVTDLPVCSIKGLADEQLISLIVLELICNAASHSSDGVVQVTVRVPQPQQLVFTVCNRGDASLPDDLFARASASPDAFHGSIGLGLQVVSLCARYHGGSLFLSEGPDHTINAAASIRLTEVPDTQVLRLSPLPIQDIPLSYMILSPILPPELYDLRNLQ